MRLGIFAKVFARPGLDAILDAIVGHGLRHVQFNLACVGLPSLPESLPAGTCRQIRSAFESKGVEMAALSATFNMIHPRPEQRAAGFRGLEVLSAAAPDLGTSVLTLCTGTRDPDDMWRGHAENDSPAAWDELLVAMDTALSIAARHAVTLGVEPEAANVIGNARKARALLDHFRSPHLRIIFDPANLVSHGQLGRMRAIFEQALELLGRDVIIAHAKDLSPGEDTEFQAAGTGALDYDRFLELLGRTGFSGPLILHSLREDQVASSLAFLRAKLRQSPPAQAS